MTTPPRPPHDVRVSLWRAAVGFRVAALVYLVVVHVRLHDRYAHPGVGAAVLVGVAVVTVGLVVAVLAGLPSGPRAVQAGVVAADVVLTAGLTLATVLVQAPADYGPGRIPTVTTVWAAGPLLEAAIVGGVGWGLVAAVAQFLASVFAHGTGANDSVGDGTLANGAILVLTAAATGYAARVAVRGQEQLLVAAAVEARLAERERLARSIHDGALQALALVQRRLRDPLTDGERQRLADLAGDQEIAMRSLLTAAPAPVATDAQHDVMALLKPFADATVTVSGPAAPVLLPAHAAAELAAAVRAALDNVERHAGEGARAWVFVDAAVGEVAVTVRDDGVGMPRSRLGEARGQGRLGFAGSVRGRIADLGGTVDVITATGQGVELCLRVPTVTTP